MPFSYLVLALLFGAAPTIFHAVSSRLHAAILTLCLAVGIAGSIASFAPYPWTDLVGVGAAIAGGMLLGRVLPARFRAMAVLLLVLGALDSVQVLAAGSDATKPAWQYYTMVVVATPWHQSEIGAADLLLIVATAEHFRRRGAPLAVMLTPGFVGLAAADAVTYWYQAGLPLVPFLFTGFVVTEAVVRRFSLVEDSVRMQTDGIGSKELGKVRHTQDP
ncbi:MAG TPA: hypothetical protein VFL27_14030 [Candidatus Dormibacteraeota bacterium]|nr:hypothetical protein [Candidatus Dormibacteraeota bacterium]